SRAIVCQTQSRQIGSRSATPSALAAPGRRAARRAPQPPRSAGSGGGPSLNYLIRPRQYGWRDRHAEDLGGLEVDHELERSGLLDWKPKIRALEGAIDIR